MNWLSWFSKTDRPAGAGKFEHCVTVHIRSSGDGFGTWAERTSIHRLSDRLSVVIDSNGLGEYDGDEFGGGGATLYMYGPNSEQIFDAILPLLRDASVTVSHAVLRYGPPGAPSKTVEIVSNSDG